jgi:cysteine desulfurase
MWPFFSTQPKTPEPAKRLYLDYAAATPVWPEVVAAMNPYWSQCFGNPSAIHAEGMAAAAALYSARTTVAEILQVKPEGIVFTSGGTESNTLAIKGTVARLLATGIPTRDIEIITTKLEHPATLKTVAALAAEGVVVTYAPVDDTGRILQQEFLRLLSPRTRLVSISYVNSEIGTIEDVGGLARLLEKARRDNGCDAYLHVDAAQAPLWLPCEISRLGADLLSLDAGKFGGPKGVGVLARAKGVSLRAVTYGGGQESGLRPGTEALPLIVGCATALKIAAGGQTERHASVTAVRDYAIALIERTIPEVILNGARADRRVANNINLSIPGLDSEFAVVSLDSAGIACSTKSACSAAGGGESTVVKAISGDTARAQSTLRFTLGPTTAKSDIDTLVTVLAGHVATQTQYRQNFDTV